jgi:hypothetical protein
MLLYFLQLIFSLPAPKKVKYPLPEVVVIHTDPTCLADLASLERYILEELNVRRLTLSADKAAYGVTLRAEPDHKTLGLRLKGAFKSVMADIRALSDERLTAFLRGSEPLTVQGMDQISIKSANPKCRLFLKIDQERYPT